MSNFWPLEVSFKGGTVGKRVKFYGRPIISKASGSQLTIGNDFHAYSDLRSNVLGCFQPCVLRTLFSESEIIIGSNVGMSSTVICAGSSIQIGDDVVIGAGAMILDNDFHRPISDFQWDLATQNMARPVKIGRGVFIGTRAIILKGVTIGERAIIGAGAVVSKNIPAGYIAVGNPAQVHPRKDIPDISPGK